MLRIHRIAPLSSVQDAGRNPWRALGVPVAGPLDAWSHAVANVLVGNPPGAAALEIGYGRSLLQFESPALVALTGARSPLHAQGLALPMWRPLAVAAGTRLAIDPAQFGARNYLAVCGGIDSVEVLGSRSAMTDAAGFPKLLRAGDCLPLTPGGGAQWRLLRELPSGRAARAAHWWADGEPLLDLEAHASLRVIDGAHAHLLGDRRALYLGRFTLSPAANRMAAPLLGVPLAVAAAGALPSEPVVPGTIQLPPDGRPVILQAEAQTIGGYARIAQLASVDLARLAQRRPGAPIRFEPISIDSAQRLVVWRHERLMRLRIAALERLSR
ncbi:MAG: biotin-dependent carboxyltransferase family protein [Xanthomonadales bacterium]|nr:KipI antagonist [Xanthomonadales bacterium]MCC6593845.1 biotin-dependent carboxyltransferase family protein [Xanthomonadales bacterium]MCE7929946.1 biotin-dependent carboxyltransferase [Xanthomonadales bacterium PRO6]